MRAKIFCIFGPTASGKTDLAMYLAQHFPFDIISVDSAMVYCGMDIGTAKPTPEELRLAPHRLINICDPSENYSAGQFCHDARKEIATILAQGRLPLLVGGTMLYFHLLQRGFAEFPKSDLAIRESIQQKAEKVGWQKLHEELVKLDPGSVKHIHANDRQRISRALELFYSTGKTLAELQQEQHWQESPYDFINIVINPAERQLVHQRIERRFDKMLSEGLVDEVNQLFLRGDLDESFASVRTVGYRQVWSYLQGNLSKEEMRDRAIIATRQFAKRQFTWLRRQQDAQWFCSDNENFHQILADWIIRQLDS